MKNMHYYYFSATAKPRLEREGLKAENLFFQNEMSVS